ncbi:cell wall metabolism sensor histidine kinase WalK [Ornithinibacillus sp. 4-3]|uniref:histidine kinase n=1 Tax=Ornithinibacillus sp. 4-3 TaxID=3231488 RepID=A0AB39HN08_9BACI
MNKVGFFRSIHLKFIIIYILLLLVAIQVIGSYFARQIEIELMDTFEESINNRVDLLNYNLEQAFNKPRTGSEEEQSLEEEVQKIVTDIDTTSITNLQVINSQSRVLATNDFSRRDIIGKRTTDSTVRDALLYELPRENTMLDTQTQNRVYVKAQPIFNIEGNVVGVIYLETSLEGVYGQVQKINSIFLQGSILAIAVSAFIGILVARTITKPIIEMRRQAQKMARGDFSQKVNVYGSDEISHLAEAFNDLNDKLKHSIASTEKEQQKLSSVLANMSEGVIATDKAGEITLMNEAAGKLIGRNPGIIKGEFLLDFLQLEDRVVDISELPKTGSMIIDLSEDETFLIRANFSTIFDDNDEITGFITVLSDVTEQEKMEMERREFVSNVSHELRTPLTTMRSYVEALSDGAIDNKELAPKFLKVAQDETERMIRLVNDLLQLSRMDSKEYALNRKRTEFISYFHHIIDRFEMNITDNITIERQLPKGKLFVWMDEDKMTQILDNIISNAIKYSPEGGMISCRVEKLDNRQLLVSIEDRGLGIPFEMRDKIFDRFYRVDRARTRKLGGSGLGLAITKELVEAHYGKIWVESIEGKGTTILFTLPLMNQKRRGEK